MKLTDTAIKAIQPTGKKQSYPDGGGLTLIVTAKGAKTWRFRYDRPNQYRRTQNDLTLGKYPAVSLKNARELRDESKKLLEKGIDPAIKRQQDKLKDVLNGQNTVRVITKQWHDLYKTSVSAEQAQKTMRRLNINVLHYIGDLPIDTITTPMLTQIIKRIAKRGAYDIAKRVLSTCKEVFRFAAVHEYIASNPLINIKAKDLVPNRVVVHQKRVDVSAFPQLLHDINNHHGNQLHKLALQLMALVFVRHDELRFAEWSEFDFDKKMWTIPAHKMKMKTEHFVPLSPEVLTLLECIKVISGGNKYLFPSTQSSSGVMSEAAMLNILYDIGYKGIQTVHGFRGLASTIINERDRTLKDVVELQLSHLTGTAVERAYNTAQHIPERTKMMNDWSHYITSLTQVKP